MTATTTAENLQQFKIRFSLILEQILAFVQALTWLEKEKISLKISNRLRDDILSY